MEKAEIGVDNSHSLPDMLTNRSIPSSHIIPELAYENVPDAAAWH
jgi:hypothetical protein